MKRLVVVALIATAAAMAAGGARQIETTLRPNLAAAERLADWDLDGSGDWTIRAGMMILAKAGTPSGAIRRPSALAILKSPDFRRASVAAEIRSTADVTVVNRDLEIILAYQGPARFYYVHLAGITNDVHNGIFLVADADRKRIDPGASPPQLKDQSWHQARVAWDGATGHIDVYVDGSAKPVMQAIDRTLTTGRVGLGSFDDTGEFRNIVVRGSK